MVNSLLAQMGVARIRRSHILYCEVKCSRRVPQERPEIIIPYLCHKKKLCVKNRIRNDFQDSRLTALNDVLVYEGEEKDDVWDCFQP